MLWSTFTSLAVMAATAQARPSLNSRQAKDPEICTYERTDPNAMKNAHADQYFSNFLTREDGLAWWSNNWLRAIDEFSSGTVDGGPFHSTLDCSTVEDSKNCLTPDLGTECRFFTPPEVYWIRLWAPNVQTFFDAARNKVVKDAVSQSFKIDSLASDFNLGSFDKPIDLSLISAIAWVIAPTLGYAASVSTVLRKQPGKKLEGALLFGNFAADETAAATGLAALIASRHEELTPEQLAELIKGLYVDYFDAKYDHITNLNKQYFTGVDGVLIQPFVNSLISMGVEVNTNLHPVAQILGSGVFSSGTVNEGLDQTLEAGFRIAKAQMIGALLAVQGVVVFGNTNPNTGGVNPSCQGQFDLWDGDICLEWRRVQQQGRNLASERLSDDVLGKISNYGVDAKEVMQSVKACGNKFQEDGDDGSGFQSQYPHCWFAMPYFEADDSPQCMQPPPPGFDYQKCVTEPVLPHGGPRID